jgi:FUN14 family
MSASAERDLDRATTHRYSMASLYTQMFSYRTALHRTSFRHSLAGATRPSWKTLLASPSKPIRASSWPPSNPVVTTKRVPSAIVRLTGTGIAGAGLGLSLYTNFQKVNCECTSNHSTLTTNILFLLRVLGTAATASSPPRPRWTSPAGPPDLTGLPPPPESSVNMYELTFGSVCGVCAGIFVKKGAKALALFFGGVFVLLQVSHCQRTYHGMMFSEDSMLTHIPK